MTQSAPSLTRYAWLSVVTAVITIGMKTMAYLLTGSVGILSEAVESLVNLAGAAFALDYFMLKPPYDALQDDQNKKYADFMNAEG